MERTTAIARRQTAAFFRHPVAYIDERASRPGYATAVTIITFLAGFLATILASDIKASFPVKIPGWQYPWSLLSASTIHWSAKAFWAFVIVWFFLFWRRQKAESKALSALQSNASLTAEAVLTLPPRAFVDDYSLQMSLLGSSPVQRFAEESVTLSPTSRQQLEDWITRLLRITAALALSYDARPEVRYAANVMIYIPRDPASADNFPGI